MIRTIKKLVEQAMTIADKASSAYRSKSAKRSIVSLSKRGQNLAKDIVDFVKKIFR